MMLFWLVLLILRFFLRMLSSVSRFWLVFDGLVFFLMRRLFWGRIFLIFFVLVLRRRCSMRRVSVIWFFFSISLVLSLLMVLSKCVFWCFVSMVVLSLVVIWLWLSLVSWSEVGCVNFEEYRFIWYSWCVVCGCC